MVNERVTVQYIIKDLCTLMLVGVFVNECHCELLIFESVMNKEQEFHTDFLMKDLRQGYGGEGKVVYYGLLNVLMLHNRQSCKQMRWMNV